MSINGYGWLPRNPYRWKGVDAGPSGVLSFDYGWPAGGTSEPNVAAQWTFDEGSGSIVDEVAALSLAQNGSPTYSQSASGPWSKLSPGIKFVRATADRFYISGAQPSVANGTDDAVFEWVLKLESSANNKELIWNTWAGQGTLIEFTRTATPTYNFDFRLIGPGGTLTIAIPFDGSVYGDGDFHKWRLALDRSGNAELFLDGATQGTADVSAHAANDIPAQAIVLSGAFGEELDMTVLEYRLTIGNATNNSGGPNGG